MNRATRAGLFVVPILWSLGLVPPAAGSVYTDVVVADKEAWVKRRATGGVNMILSSVGWDQRSAGPPQRAGTRPHRRSSLVVGRRCAGPTHGTPYPTISRAT